MGQIISFSNVRKGLPKLTNGRSFQIKPIITEIQSNIVLLRE